MGEDGGSDLMAVKKLTLRHGEDALARVDRFEVVLEDGACFRVNLAEELHTPTSGTELLREAAHAPARMLFFGAQETRALAKVRQLERELAHARGSTWVMMTSYLREEAGEKFLSGAHVQAYVDTDPDVGKCQESLDTAREHYGILRELRRALDHRVSLLKQLVAQLDRAIQQG